MIIKIILSIMFLLVQIGLVQAQDRLAERVDQTCLGWNFYCDKVLNKNEKEEVPQQEEFRTKDRGTVKQAQQQLDEIKQRYQDLSIRALIFQNPENMKELLSYQNSIIDRSLSFADVLEEVRWQNPFLDALVKDPVNNVGHNIIQDIRSEDIKKYMSNLNDRYGLFFIYSSKCPFCQQYSPIIAQFSKLHNIHVQAVTIDNINLPEWPDTLVDAGQLKSLGLSGKPVPMTILFDKETQETVSVGFGLLAMDEIEDRLFKILKQREML